MREVAVGFEPRGDTLLDFFFGGDPVHWFLFEVGPVVMEGDILNGPQDLGTGFGHLFGEIFVVAISVMPTLGDEDDEYLVVLVGVRGVFSKVGGEYVQARVGVWRTVVRDESQGFGDHRVGVDVDFVSTFRPQD